MRKTGLTFPRYILGFAAAAAMALPALPGHAAEERKTEAIGPWQIEAIFKGDKFDRCAIERTLNDGIVARFIRTPDDLSLELESPNWKLERDKSYPVTMAIGPLSFETEVEAESGSVSMAVKDAKFESGLRNASALSVVAAGATIRVPLDDSRIAFDRLAQCVEKNNRSVESNPFVAPPRKP